MDIFNDRRLFAKVSETFDSANVVPRMGRSIRRDVAAVSSIRSGMS